MGDPCLASFSPTLPPKSKAGSAEFRGNQIPSMEYRDQLNRIFVDAEDSEENRQFFIDLRTRLKSRFQQLDIWLTVHPIEIL